MTPVLLPIVLWLTAANPPPIVAVAFAPEGTQVLAASQGGVQTLTWPELKQRERIETKLPQVHDLAFSPAGNRLAIVGGSPGEQGAAEIWEWPAAKLVRTLSAGDDLAYQASWSRDGQTLAIACADKAVRIQPADGSPARVIQAHSAAVLAVAWLCESNVYSAGVDQSLRVLAPASGETLRTFDNHTAAVRDLAIRVGKHEGPPLLASASTDRTVRFWQPTIGRLVRFKKLPSAATALCWTPAGSHVLAACEDGHLRAVDPETLEITVFATALSGWAYAVAASPDGHHALLAGEKGELRKVALDAIKR